MGSHSEIMDIVHDKQLQTRTSHDLDALGILTIAQVLRHQEHLRSKNAFDPNLTSRIITVPHDTHIGLYQLIITNTTLMTIAIAHVYLH